MKNRLKQLILEAADKAHQNGDLPSSEFPEVEIEEPKAASHGDFSTNVAMQMASVQRMPPRKISELILAAIDDRDSIVEKTEIAGPGFINFFLTPSAWYPYLKMVHDQGALYGASDIGQGKRVQVEFVSANPTGPLHVGHGRGAAVGDSVAGILSFCGYSVQREYYVNDSGRQIR
ncbi:MAG: arginine--tRNA ligase, partial [Deltaproteobacteria bacterium]|nr:arginine--tRNA ligase [Deltaproteobacteria bacterium]